MKTASAEKITFKLPLIKFSDKNITSEFFDYKYPFYCSNCEANYSWDIPKFTSEEDKVSILNEIMPTLIKNPMRNYFTAHRLYSEFYTAVKFMETVMPKYKSKKFIIFESKPIIISSLLAELYDIEIHSFGIKPAMECMNNKVKYYERFPTEEDFKKLAGGILINFNIFMTEIFYHNVLVKCVMAEHEYACFLMNKLKPSAAIHILRGIVQRGTMSTIPKGKIIMVPYTQCTTSHSFAVICDTTATEKIDAHKLSLRLILFDLCVRNLNHGDDDYDNWDNYICKKLPVPNKDLVHKILGELPNLSDYNPIKLMSQRGLMPTNPKYFEENTTKQNFDRGSITYFYEKYSEIAPH